MRGDIPMIEPQTMFEQLLRGGLGDLSVDNANRMLAALGQPALSFDDFQVELKKAASDLQARQRVCDDPFERMDAFLWSRLSPERACTIFLKIMAIADTIQEPDRLMTLRRMFQSEILRAIACEGVS